MWNTYLDNFEPLALTTNIPINQDNYLSQIVEFDVNFIRIGAKYGMYKFIPKEYDREGLLEKYIADYTAYKKTILDLNSRDMFEFIHFLSIREWIRDTKQKGLYEFIEVPILQEKKYIYDEMNISIFSNEDGTFLFSISPDFIEKSDFSVIPSDETLMLKLYISSFSNIWLSEFERTAGDFNEPIIFEPPYNNRSIAYRITPRYNSFIRDMGTIAKKMGGSVSGVTNYDISPEGYLFLDNQIIFQEDIDSGKVKIPE